MLAYARCVYRSAGMKWLSFNFTARAHASVKYQPSTLVTIITEIQIVFPNLSFFVVESVLGYLD
jgi:hypothetical protein